MSKIYIIVCVPHPRLCKTQTSAAHSSAVNVAAISLFVLFHLITTLMRPDLVGLLSGQAGTGVSSADRIYNNQQV